MRDKKQYRDRVDVRFDDRFRFNRHREGAEKNGRENCVEHAGGEMSLLNHICVRVVVESWWMRVLRNNALVFIDERREKRKHTLECVSFFEEFSNSNPSLNNNDEHFAYS